MKRPEQSDVPLDADEKYIRLSEEDIPEILDALRGQKNAEKFTALFDGGIIPDGLSQSEADASLCAMIAFRTGPDPEMIDAVFASPLSIGINGNGTITGPPPSRRGSGPARASSTTA